MYRKKLLSLLAVTVFVFTNSLLAQQPYGGCWHPQHIINWSPETDPDAKFNRSTVPLKPRFYDDGIKANSNQFYDGKVAACLTMNPMASQTPSQGANNFIGYNPTYWQYMDLLIWWGGSAGEGVLVLPSAPVVDIAHLNGVKVLANIFFPPKVFGGQDAWVHEMLTEEGGTFPYAKKLYEIAKYYGFDGWFINEETVRTEQAKWVQFIKYFYQLAEADGNYSMEMQWYDNNRTVDRVENVLKTNINTSFFSDYGGVSSISSNNGLMTLWGYTPEQTFRKVYYGLEVAQGGLAGNSSYFKSLFPADKHNGSVDLFNVEEPTWKKVVESLLNTPNNNGAQAYQAMNVVFKNEARYWTNIQNDPSNTTSRSGSTWPGLANAIQERSSIQEKPFVTSFSAGLGKHRFVNGEKKGTQDWYHRGMQNVLPTWRWWVEATDGGAASDLSFTYNWDEAYNMGTSVHVTGALKAGAQYLTRLYKTKLGIESGDKFELVYKTSNSGTIQVKLATTENPTSFTTFNVSETSSQNGWSKASIDISSLAGKTVSVIALNFTSASAVSSYDLKLGQLGIVSGSYAPAAISVTNLASQNELKEEISDIRLIWDSPESDDLHHFNVYMERNGVKSLVGQTRNEGFYISKFSRSGREETSLKVSVAAVTKDLKEGTPVDLQLNFPALTAPVVSLSASPTMVKVGETVTVTAVANNFPDTYEWTVPQNAELVSQTDNKAVFRYNAEGKYDIKVKVSNAVGSTEKTESAYVEVSNSKVIGIVSIGKKIDSANGWLGEEKPQNLIDGFTVPSSINAKWCFGGEKSHWVIIDLEDVYSLYRFRIFDCGHKENASDNFKNYKIELSLDKQNWTEVVNEKGIPATAEYNTKDAWIKSTAARYIRFTPYDEEMPITIRIWEFQAYGVESNVKLDGFEDKQAFVKETVPVEVSYTLGDEPKEDNFKVSITPENPNVLAIENITVTDDGKIKFDIKTGVNEAETNITVVVHNGQSAASKTFKITILDPQNLNILVGKTPEVVLGENTDIDIPNTDEGTGAIGEAGINDGSNDTWYNTPYLAGLKTMHTIKYDLGDTYLINSLRAYFRTEGYIYFPVGIKIFASSTDTEDSSYELVAEQGIIDETIGGFSFKFEPKEMKYLKFEITTGTYTGFSLVELEAWGKIAGADVPPITLGEISNTELNAETTQTSVEGTYSLGGGAEQADFALTVVPEDTQIVTVENLTINKETEKFTFDLKAGNKEGETNVVVTLTNGGVSETVSFAVKVIVPSGIGSVKTEMFDIYPNPMKQGERVKLNAEEGAVVQVLSLQGAILLSEVTTSSNTQIDTQNLSSGTYLVTVKGKDSILKVGKLVIK